MQINSKNIEPLKRIVSRSGLSWHELYYVNENRYYTVFQVIDFPEESHYNILKKLNNRKDVFCLVDYDHMNQADFNERHNKVFEGSERKKDDAKTRSAYRKATEEQRDYEDFVDYINATKNTVKRITLRVFVFAQTLEELQSKSNEVTDELLALKMTGYIQTNNLLEDYQALTKHSNPVAQDISSGTLADLTLSSNINVVDYHAAILGMTPSGVYAPNPFSFRNHSYNLAFMGGTGAGKSAVLKKLQKNLLIKGNHTPLIFDIHKEYDDYCKRLKIPIVSFDENTHVNLMQIFYVDNDKGDSILRENDIQIKVSSIKETFRSQTGIDRRQTLLKLTGFLTKFYSEYKAKDFMELNDEDWKTLATVKEMVANEITLIQSEGWNGLDSNGEPAIRKEYQEDLYNIQTGLNDMCTNYGYIYDRKTNIDFDLSKPLCFDLSFLRNNSDINVLGSYVMLVLNYAAQGEYINLQKNLEMERRLDKRLSAKTHHEPYFTHSVIIDEFMKYAGNRGFLNEINNHLKYMRKAFSQLVIVVHTTQDTQKDLDNAGDLLSSIFDLCTTKYIGKSELESAKLLPGLLQGVTMNDAITVSKFIKGENGERKFLVVDDQKRKLYFTSIITEREQSYFKGGV